MIFFKCRRCADTPRDILSSGVLLGLRLASFFLAEDLIFEQGRQEVGATFHPRAAGEGEGWAWAGSVLSLTESAGAFPKGILLYPSTSPH